MTKTLRVLRLRAVIPRTMNMKIVIPSTEIAEQFPDIQKTAQSAVLKKFLINHI